MADSGQRLIAGSNDRYVALDGAEIVREFTPPSGWQELRLGVQCGFPDSGGNISGAQLAIGLCAGVSSSYNSGTPAHWVGMVMKDDSLGTFSRQTSPVNFYSGGTSQVAPLKIENGVHTLASYSMLIKVPRFDAAATWYRGIITMRIRKAAPTTYHVDVGYADTSFWADWTMEDVWECLEWPLYGFQDISNGGRCTEQAGGSLTVNEGTYGTLDHVNIWWNKSVPKLEIFGIALQRYK